MAKRTGEVNMSGGHWDYIQFRIEEIANELNPNILQEERELGSLLLDISKVIHDADWWKSGDTSEEPFIQSWNNFKQKWLKEQLTKEERKE